MIIWLVGPLIAIAGHEPLEPENNRLIAIAVVVLLWGLNQLRRYLAARKKNRQMLDSVVMPTGRRCLCQAQIGRRVGGSAAAVK